MPLAQIVIPTADLAASRAWYQRNFGMALTFEAPNVAALTLDGVRYIAVVRDPAGVAVGLYQSIPTSRGGVG